MRTNMLSVRKVSSESAEIVHAIQKKSFESLLDKYKDYDTNPAMETMDRIREKMEHPSTTSYIFQLNDVNVGWVRVTELEGKTFKISALCVLPEYRDRGIAQDALTKIEGYHSDAAKWVLSTILEEKGNCHLYEKLGYIQNKGDLLIINEKMTLVFYEKMK